MKLTNSEIIRAIDALDALSDKEMPIELTFKVVRNVDALMNRYNVYTRTLETLKSRYREGTPQFESEVKKLLDCEVAVDTEPFTREEFTDADVRITPLELMGLKVLIDG